MREQQEHEQYFFSQETLAHLATFASRFDSPCCLCTPSLGAELERRGVRATTLDTDMRFSALRGFRYYDLNRPGQPEQHFGLIVCDPPFFTVPLPQLLKAVTMLSRRSYEQPLLVNYLSRNASIITRVFARFGLQPTGYKPMYATIQNIGRNEMQFFGNLAPDASLKPPMTAISVQPDRPL